MAFSMQDLMASLPGSPGSQPQVAPTFNPQINTQQLATNVQANQDAAKSAKNEKLSLMFYALSGALKGDKDFVKNTFALQAMQEGKKKEAERKKRFDEAMEKMDPNSPLYKFALAVGSDGVDKIAAAEFDLATRVPKEDNIADYKAYLAKKYKQGTPLTAQDRELESFVFNLSSFERYARGSGAGSSEGQDESNPISVSNYEDAEAYPKGTWVNFNGNVVQVD